MDKRNFYALEQLKNAKLKRTNSIHVDELIFRMIDYYNINSIDLLNVNDLTKDYIFKANSKGNLNIIQSTNDTSNSDLLLIESLNEEEIEKGNYHFIIITNPRLSPTKTAFFSSLKEDKNINLTLDLFDITIAVIDDSFKVKQHFDLRY